MSPVKLTKTIIDAATFQGRRYRGTDGEERFSRFVLWDDEIPGFGLRITPAGRKTFVLSYRVRGRKKLMKLGVFGQVTLDQARKMARRELVTILDGGDPLETRRQERQQQANAKTMAELAELYLELHASKKKPTSLRCDKSLIRCHLLPALANRKVESVSQQDVARLHMAKRSTPYQANRLLALLSKMFNLAEQWGLRPPGTNPCRGVKRFKEAKRERFLSTEELRRLGKALAAVEKDRSEHPSAILAIRLLLLTGARKMEILRLRWEEVSFERRCLRLTDSKTGEKTIPLSASALELLVEAPRQEDNPYVCHGHHEGKHLVGLHHIWARIAQQAGLEDVRIHDLRHSFAAVGAGGGLGLPVIGALLGHRMPQTTARYAHVAEDPLYEAVERISGEIAAALNDNQEEQEESRSSRN